MKTWYFGVALIVGLFAFSACYSNNADKPVVVVSILPQEYFARSIGEDRIRIMVLSDHSKNPHNFEPSPRQMRELAGAKAWVLSGTEFEISLVPKIENQFADLLIVDGTEGVNFRTLEENDDHHEGVSDHDDLNIDRHSWLGCQGAVIMAYHIRDTLCALDEANAFFYRNNCEILVNEINAEFNKLRNELRDMEGRTVFVYHPAFGYFLDEFGIIQQAVETGGKEPTARMLRETIEKARKENVKVIFVQVQFPVESAGTIAAATGAQLVFLDPLSPDWLANIREMGDALKRAVSIE